MGSFERAGPATSLGWSVITKNNPKTMNNIQKCNLFRRLEVGQVGYLNTGEVETRKWLTKTPTSTAS